MKGLGAYIIVLFCANFAQKIYAFTAECDLGILHHQPALFNSPRDVVVDLLDLKPADYLKGVSVTRHGDNMVLYGFDDAKLRGTSITLIMGNQRLYVMPQAHNLQVKWSENMTTTEIIITYEIGGSTFKRYYHEEPFSTISSFFWSRMFSPDTAVLKIKAPSKTKATGQSAATTNANAQYETPLDYANAFIQQWNEALESFWSMVIPTNDHRRREVSAEDSDDEGSGSCEPRSVVELSDPTTYARIAKSQSWRRMKVDKLMCVTFDNIEARWNGMLFHKIKIPVPMQSTEFTVCFDAGEKQTKIVIVSALVDGVWVESYYAVQGVGTEEVQLRLVDAEEHFAYYPGLPSRDRAGECVHGGEGFTLHINSQLGKDSPLEKYENRATKVFRYKEGEDVECNCATYVEGVRFGDIEHSIPKNRSFVLLVVSNPCVANHYVTLVTRNGNSYSIDRWNSATGNEYRPVKLKDTQMVAQALSEISYVFMNRNQHGRLDIGQFNTQSINGDIICLPESDDKQKNAGKICKPLEELPNTEIILKRPQMLVLKYKASAPKGFLIIGSSIIELDNKNAGNDIDIYLDKSGDKPMTVLLSDGSNVKALRETTKGSLEFTETTNNIINVQDGARLIDVDLEEPDISSLGLKWDRNFVENVYVMKPIEHPDVAIGSVLFKNCRVLPKIGAGFTFVIAPTSKKPPVAVIFAPKSEHKHAAIMVRRITINGEAGCAVEALAYQPSPFGAEDLQRANFDTLFRAKE